MANVLYVTCNPKPIEQSRSLTIGNEFLKAYIAKNPKDRIDVLDLYRDHIQRIDIDVLTGMEKLRTGQTFSLLNEDEQRKITRIWKLADQFAAADKYVFVTPMWNFAFPAEMKTYIDDVCVAGKTYTYTEQGAVGLLLGRGKKCLHIESCGGFHHGKPEDHSASYLKSVMNFMGVEEFYSIVLEGVDAVPHKAREFTEITIAECREVAAVF